MFEDKDYQEDDELNQQELEPEDDSVMPEDHDEYSNDEYSGGEDDDTAYEPDAEDDEYQPDTDDYEGEQDMYPEDDQMDEKIENIISDEIEIENEGSKVASAPAKNILVLGALIVGSIFFLYNIIFQEDEKEVKQNETEEIIAQQPVDNAVEPTPEGEQIQVGVGVVETPEPPSIEGLAPLPPISTIEPPVQDDTFGGFEPVPPAPPPPAATPVIEPIAEDEPLPVIQPSQPQEIIISGPSAAEIAAKKAARRKAGMILMNGGGTDEQYSFDGSTSELAKTSAAQVTATDIGNTDIMIAQGKMIEAILETAINTDLPGSLRAVISRDIYAESGRNILIPKGSRLIGQYNNDIQRGQVRVIVSWSRVIRPDGVDVAIDSPGTDQLGRAGMTGIVDNKMFDIITNSILVSAFTVGGAIAVDGIEKSQGLTSSTTTGTDGSSTSSQTGTTTDFAVLDAVKDVSNVAQSIVGDMLNEQPTIVVNQGARIKVFVNRDLVFPESVASSVKVIN